jgi:predicted alpha/beta-hydrolase family hydrolase
MAAELEHTPITIALDEKSDAMSGILASSSRAEQRPFGVVLAHGAGANMTTPRLVAVADGLAARGVTTLRFNFPYMEARRKVPDPMPKLERAYKAAIAALRERLPPEAPIVIGGKSMGGRVATHLAAKGEAIRGVVLLGYPLHPPKQPERLRDAHLPSVPVPMLFVQGTRDTLCDLALLRPVLARVGDRAKLHVVEGGDHSLDVLKSSGRTRESVDLEVVDVIDAWLRALG